MKYIYISVVLSIFAISSTYWNHHMEKMVQEETPNIVEIASDNEDFETLVAAVGAADLAETLSWDGPFTVFAPSDDAFAELPEGTLEMLLMPENKDMLVYILTYHVVPGKVMAQDLSNGLSATSVQGSDINFQYYKNAWFVQNANIVSTDIQANNGVIHVIDSVIMPPKTQEARDAEISTLKMTLTNQEQEKVDTVVNKFQNITSSLSNMAQEQVKNRIIFLINMKIEEFAANESITNMLTLLKLEMMNL